MPLLFAAALRMLTRPFSWLAARIAAERDRFTVWLPVFMGAGVLAYFSLRVEPPVWAGAAGLGPALAVWVVGRHFAAVRLVLPPVIAACLGFTSGQIATARAP